MMPYPFDSISDFAKSLPPIKGNWTAREIVGPFDLWQAMETRKLVKDRVRWGEEVPVDVFLLSLGVPHQRNITQLGGLPYWNRDNDWPRTASGIPMQFLAQLDFSESKDLVGDLPEDLLMIFGNPEHKTDLQIFWQAEVPLTSLISTAEMPSHSSLPTFYGTRWRTTNYRDWEPHDQESWSDMALSNGDSVSNLYFAMRLLGVTIGSCPFLTATSPLPRQGEQILCCLPTISPALNVPYPFLNHPHPIEERELDRYIFPVSDAHDADSFGLIYVVKQADGRFRLECDGL